MNRLFGYLIGLLFLALMAPGSAWAATYVVDTTVDNGALSACTAAAGDCSLRGAVNAVNAGAGGDIISLPAGTYTLTGAVDEDANASGDLDITKAVTIQGFGAVSTIIDGNGATTSDRVIHVTAAVALTLDGVTITGGKATTFVGGIFTNGALTMTNSTISGNTAGTDYGGIFASNAVTVTNSTISNNSAAGSHGGIASNGDVTVTNSTISNNSAGGSYGGIYSFGAVTVTNSTISGNTAGTEFGGISSNGTLTVTNSTISGNSAGVNLGGIYSLGAVTVTNSTISGNSAGGLYGGIYSSRALTVTNSTISGNSATTGSVGGIHVNNGGTITNSTISGNSAATWGGAINNRSAPLSITNSTIVGNSSGNGALFAFLAGANITLNNSIIAGNTGGNCAFAGGAFISSGYNIDSDGLCNLVAGTDLPNNALITGSLGALANNGGATKTHALLAGSPAIDTGSCVNTTDQRGISRPRDGNADKLARCDMGAYEYSSGTNPSNGLNLFIIGSGTVSDGIPSSNMNPCVFIPLTGCYEYYDSSATISLTAINGTDQFIGWNGTISGGQNPLSLSMNQFHNITATFGAQGVGVTVVGTGTVIGATILNCPASWCASAVLPGLYNLTATPTAGAIFTGWTVTGAGPGTTCAGTTSPCDVEVIAGSVARLTAKFDKPGCTSPTATNYDPTATLNDGSCVFPAPPPSGGGGSGGGGLENQGPYFPGGGTWLVSPNQSGKGNGNTPFVWRILTDLDGDEILYYLYVCPGGDFENCQPLDVVRGNDNANARYSAALGASGMALLLIGFGFTRGGRRTMLVAIAALSLTGSAALIACGASSDSSSGVTVKACSAADAESLCRENLSLAPGAYQWKVIADDGRDGQLESEVRSFVVE
ncbi:MAG: hypothetical protein OEZ32_11735, partial [Nitrospinota bacterium]|nr:hypothetical protein [Nitrospinota bacterium]